MAVESVSLKTVELLADKVLEYLFRYKYSCSLRFSEEAIFHTSSDHQVEMLGKEGISKNFNDLGMEEKDLTMFSIKSLILSKSGKEVKMKIVFKRKITTELLTTFLPTILLLLITFTSILFDQDLFGDALAVNLTIMLVMTTIFTSKIEELPSTSDTKMIDIWLIGCLLVPFTEVVLRTIIEVLGNCHPCKEVEAKDACEDERKKAKRSAWENPQCSPVMSSKDLTPFPAELTFKV